MVLDSWKGSGGWGFLELRLLFPHPCVALCLSPRGARNGLALKPGLGELARILSFVLVSLSP